MIPSWPVGEVNNSFLLGEVCLGLNYFVSSYHYMVYYLSVCLFTVSYLEKGTVKLFFFNISN